MTRIEKHFQPHWLPDKCSSQHPLGGPLQWSELHAGSYSACIIQSWELPFVSIQFLDIMGDVFFEYINFYILRHITLVVWLQISRCKCTEWCKQDVEVDVVEVEYNDSLTPLRRRCWVGWEFPYLGRLVRSMFPWLQNSWGGGEPDAEQTRRISSPRENAWLCGWTTTEGASASGVKQRQVTQGLVSAAWCHLQLPHQALSS